MVRTKLSPSLKVWFKSSRECKILQIDEDGSIQNLVIVSNKGYYSVEHGIKDLEKLFADTIIAWKFA
jgi:hypothetical protein